MKRFAPFVIILAVLSIALGAGYYLTRPDQKRDPLMVSKSTSPTSPGGGPSSSAISSSESTPTKVGPGAVPPHAIGPPDAPVTLEEFGDFECPPCGLLHPVLKSMEQEFGQRLRVIFREFPLVPTHQHALNAARAAEAAGLQGKFWEMHDLLFENQRTWHEAFDARPVFEGYAVKLKLNLEQFRRDLGSKVVEQRIFLDGKRAHDLGVKGTPTVFINGREVPFESLAPDKLRELIKNELNSKPK